MPIRIYSLGIGSRLTRMKRTGLALATAAALLAALGAGGCGGDGGATTSSATTGGSSSTATATAPPPTRPPSGGGEHPRRTDTAAGGQEPVRVPATFTLRAGRLTPGSVTVPPFLAIQVSVRSLDPGPRTVTIRADRPYRLAIPARGRAVRTLPGQRAGSYPVAVAGGGRATLVVGGEPGP